MYNLEERAKERDKVLPVPMMQPSKSENSRKFGNDETKLIIGIQRYFDRYLYSRQRSNGDLITEYIDVSTFLWHFYSLRIYQLPSIVIHRVTARHELERQRFEEPDVRPSAKLVNRVLDPVGAQHPLPNHARHNKGQRERVQVDRPKGVLKADFLINQSRENKANGEREREREHTVEKDVFDRVSPARVPRCIKQAVVLRQTHEVLGHDEFFKPIPLVSKAYPREPTIFAAVKQADWKLELDRWREQLDRQQLGFREGVENGPQ